MPTGPFKWTRPFRHKTKSVSFTCANTFQLASIAVYILKLVYVLHLSSLDAGSYCRDITQYVSVYLNISQYISMHGQQIFTSSHNRFDVRSVSIFSI